MDPMIQLKGVPTPPPADTYPVKSLIYYDGVFLEHYRRPSTNDTYLYYWVDCDTTVNRWMILRVAPDTVQRLTNAEIALDHVIPGLCLDGFVCIADKNNDLEVTQSLQVELADIPLSYRPKSGSYLRIGRKKKG